MSTTKVQSEDSPAHGVLRLENVIIFRCCSLRSLQGGLTKAPKYDYHKLHLRRARSEIELSPTNGRQTYYPKEAVGLVLEEDDLTLRRRRGFIRGMQYGGALMGIIIMIFGLWAVFHFYDDPFSEEGDGGFLTFLIPCGFMIMLFSLVLFLYDFNLKTIAFFTNGIVLTDLNPDKWDMDFIPWGEFTFYKHIDYPILGPSLQVAWFGQRILIPASMEGYNIAETLVTTHVPVK
jgi:hypothetical protein